MTLFTGDEAIDLYYFGAARALDRLIPLVHGEIHRIAERCIEELTAYARQSFPGKRFETTAPPVPPDHEGVDG